MKGGSKNFRRNFVEFADLQKYLLYAIIKAKIRESKRNP
jgi:hypothetical protein